MLREATVDRERLAELRDTAEAAGKRVLALRERCEDLDVPGGDLNALRQAVGQAAACESRLAEEHRRLRGVA